MRVYWHKDTTEVNEFCTYHGDIKIAAFWVLPPSSLVPVSFKLQMKEAVFSFLLMCQSKLHRAL
jgi:hypothetical protein